ncbi:MAG: hypothetical protein ACO3GZ_08065 [Ilumatobacteraceae bacterium]
MSAPKFAPTPVLDEVRTYSSPEVAPAAWSNNRPTDIEGFQPSGERLGYQGPDQGYGLTLANRMRDRLKLVGGVSADDAVRGCLNIALRRASLYGRAPVVHDLTIAFTMWGFFDANPPHDLVARRSELFKGVGNVHHYAEGRAIADLVPEATLRMTPAAVAAVTPVAWRTLTGA